MKSTTIIASVLTVFLATIGSAEAKRPLFPKIVVFGDSTSDIGNTWLLTGQEVWDPTTWNGVLDTLPTEPVPPLYDDGRWSNGPMWVELLNELINARGEMTPSLQGGLNYAFTDALVGEGENVRFSVWAPDILPPPLVPSIGEQIRIHTDTQGGIGRKHLVVLWDGTNDVFLAAQNPNADPVVAIEIAVEKLIGHVQQLVALGAKNILVPNLLDASGAPFFAELSPPEQAAIKGLTEYFNFLLDVSLTQLQSTLSEDITLYPVDFYSVGTNALAECSLNSTEPAALAYLTNLLSGNPLNLGDPQDIKDPYFDNFVFWDTIHPTKAMHDLLAQAAASVFLDDFVPDACPSTL